MLVTFTLNTKGFDLAKAEVRRAAGQVVAKATADVAADYKNRITDNTGKSGRYYKLRGTTRKVKHDGKRAGQLRAMGLEETAPGQFITGSIIHRASAPEQAPANRYGDLAKGITFEVDAENLIGYVESSEPYAPVLEFGGEDMAERPALVPALDAMSEVLPDILTAAVNHALTQAAAEAGGQS